MKGFWINDSWYLEEHLLDLINVDGDHTGKVVGKLLFQSLLSLGASKKICSP